VGAAHDVAVPQAAALVGVDPAVPVAAVAAAQDVRHAPVAALAAVLVVDPAGALAAVVPTVERSAAGAEAKVAR